MGQSDNFIRDVVKKYEWAVRGGCRQATILYGIIPILLPIFSFPMVFEAKERFVSIWSIHDVCKLNVIFMFSSLKIKIKIIYGTLFQRSGPLVELQIIKSTIETNLWGYSKDTKQTRVPMKPNRTSTFPSFPLLWLIFCPFVPRFPVEF